MRNFAEKIKTRVLLTSVCSIVIAATVGFAVFMAVRGSDAPTGTGLTGSAVAVMTTPVEIIDGKLEPAAHYDELYYPLGIALSEEAIIVADSFADRIQIIGDTDIMRIGEYGDSRISYEISGGHVDGLLANARFNKPSDVVILNGNIIVSDGGNNAIRRISGGVVTTVAGGAEAHNAGYRNGKEGEALFNNPQSVAVWNEHIYVADAMNHCIRVIDGYGNVSLFAGTPEQSGYADGGVFEAMFNEPHGIAFGADGSLYVADSSNHAIRRIKDGEVTTIAGRASSAGRAISGFADGNGQNALFNFPRDLVVMQNGDIYVTDTMNHAVRLILGNASRETRTILGNGQADEFYGSVENIRLSKPSGINSDGSTLYISDALTNSILIIPITQTLNNGRPLRDVMLYDTGVSTETHYSYRGEIRLFVNGERIRFERVHPWITPDRLFVPVTQMFEALGAKLEVNQSTGVLTVEIDGEQTLLGLNEDYFFERNVAVMPFDELQRLFPYLFEWFPEFSVIAVAGRY